MKLYKLIKKNKNLNFVDVRSKIIKTFAEIENTLEVEDIPAVVFIYNDNSLSAIETFFNFYPKKFVIALLNANLHSSFKRDIEVKYLPYYIYDPKRSGIDDYEIEQVSDTISLFKRKERFDYPIHKEVKLLFSTSGTTGTPKFVKISDHNIVQNALSIMEYMPINTNDTVPLNVPINFVYGFSILTTNCIKANTIVCTNRDVLQKKFWEDLRTYGFSTLSGVPYFYELLLRIGFFRDDTPSLRYLTHTGGMLNENLAKIISEYTKRFDKQFFAQYGQTEASGRMAFLSPQDFHHKKNSIGFPVQNGSFKIDKITRELIYHGPNVSGGYATGFDDLKSFNFNISLSTGDIAEKDEEGYYYIKGRLKRITKLFGVRLNLDEVELLLKNDLGGQTFICININDKYLGVVHQDDSLSREDILNVLKERLHLHASTLKTYYIEEVPLTPNGKVDYIHIEKLLINK